MRDLFSFGQNWVDQIKRKEGGNPNQKNVLREEQGSLAHYFYATRFQNQST